MNKTAWDSTESSPNKETNPNKQARKSKSRKDLKRSIVNMSI